jgi:hypothetical protein
MFFVAELVISRIVQFFIGIFLLSILLGAGSSFFKASGGIPGMISYVLTYGYAYGSELWKIYGWSANISRPNYDAKKAAREGPSVGSEFDEEGHLARLMTRGCSSTQCRI